jgi:hypothetical protein
LFLGEDKIGRSRLLQFIAHCLENANINFSSSTHLHNDSSEIKQDSTSTRAQTDTSSDSCLTIIDRALPSTIHVNECSSLKTCSTRVINYRCQFEQRFIEYGLLRSLLRQLLFVHNRDTTTLEREQCLLRLFDVNKTNDVHLRRNLFLFNDLLDVQFHRSNNIEQDTINNDNDLARIYETNLNELLVHVLDRLIDSSASYMTDACTSSMLNNSTARYVQRIHTTVFCRRTTDKNYSMFVASPSSMHYRSSSDAATNPSAFVLRTKIIFIIDDIHFADESSLKHLLALGSHKRCLLILAMKPPNNNNNDRPNFNTLQSIRTDSRVYLRRLPGLERRHLATLGRKSSRTFARQRHCSFV